MFMVFHSGKDSSIYVRVEYPKPRLLSMQYSLQANDLLHDRQGFLSRLIKYNVNGLSPNDGFGIFTVQVMHKLKNGGI